MIKFLTLSSGSAIFETQLGVPITLNISTITIGLENNSSERFLYQFSL